VAPAEDFVMCGIGTCASTCMVGDCTGRQKLIELLKGCGVSGTVVYYGTSMRRHVKMACNAHNACAQHLVHMYACDPSAVAWLDCVCSTVGPSWYCLIEAHIAVAGQSCTASRVH
jgi:hypothetical protein